MCKCLIEVAFISYVIMRKIFLLAGKSFTAPDPIGAGIRARINQIVADIAEEKNVKNDPEAIVQRYYYDYSVRMLEILLSSEEHNVREAYDSATDEEVKKVMDFFALSVGGKTKTEKDKTEDSNDSKKTVKQKT